MAVTSGYFDSVDGDRTYSAAQMSEYFEGLISNGVYEKVGKALVVKAGEGMSVDVGSGRAIINGRWLKNDAVLNLPITQADALLNRWTAVYIRLSTNSRSVRIDTKDGTPAANPVKPTMNHDSNYYDMCLAYVYVKAGASSISQSDITDMRASNLCGWVTGIVKQVDTSELFLQWQTAYEEFYQRFEDWFDTLTQTLNVNTYIQQFKKVATIPAYTTIGYELSDIEGYRFSENDIINVYLDGKLGDDGVDYDLVLSDDHRMATVDLHRPSTQPVKLETVILKSKIGNPPADSAVINNFDFTSSLVDDAGNNAHFFSDGDDPASVTTTPATDQFVSGTGLVMGSGKYALKIPVDMLSKVNSYSLEITFSNFELTVQSWDLGFIRTVGGGYDFPMLYSGYESDSGNLSFTRNQADVPDAFFASGISDRNYWANSTMKIVNRVTNNDNVVWDFYKDGTLAFSTPEFDPDHIAYPFFWDNSEAEKIFVITGNSGELNATITAMKVSYNE